MKLVIFIITVLICSSSIAQEEVNKNLERNNSGQVVLCKTKVTGDAEVTNIWSDVITVIPKGTKVSVYTTSEGFWSIKSSEIEGYINEKHLKVTNKMERVKNDVYNEDNTRAETNHQEGFLSEENKVWRGMSKATVRENFGEPNDIKYYGSVPGNRQGQIELWIYDNKSLYFENGILVSKKLWSSLSNVY